MRALGSCPAPGRCRVSEVSARSAHLAKDADPGQSPKPGSKDD